MINLFSKNIYLCCLLFVIFYATRYTAYSQTYSSKIEISKIEIGEKSFAGYKTNFDFESGDLKKGLWKYCKQFARLSNERTHYQIQIISSQNEGNIDIMIFGFIESMDSNSSLTLALDNTNLLAENQNKYASQAKNLLIDFKKQFYLDAYEKQIDKKIKASVKLGKQYENMMKKNRDVLETKNLLEKISQLESEMNEIRQQQIIVSKS